MDWEECRKKARGFVDQIKASNAGDLLGEARSLARKLRDYREFDLLDGIAEELRQQGEDDPAIIRLQAQSQIERGKLKTAIDLLRPIVDTTEAAEALGLIGRAYKQMYYGARDKAGDLARKALTESFTYYRRCYEKSDDKAWAGVNLLALAALSKREGVTIPEEFEPRDFAQKLIALMDSVPEQGRDNWYHASKAEAYLGLDDLDAVERHIGEYVRSADTTGFALAGTLRQFTDLWQLDQHGEQGSGIVAVLRTALLRQKEFGRLDLTPGAARDMLQQGPSEEQLQKVFGDGGLVAFKWLRVGLAKAQSVGAIRVQQKRKGTGFLVSGKEFGLGEERFVMTNAHVISEHPDDRALGAYRPGDATITFETVESPDFDFGGIAWHSPVKGGLDCVLLKLTEQPEGIEPLTLTDELPDASGLEKVYVIGYPDGGEMMFSMQDNVLLDHEGPPGGKPPNRAVCRLHYRAPTKPGSSGSPVFNASKWNVIALHHAGHTEMSKLNGKEGKWPANEGIWIQSIVAAVKGSAPKPA
jgi:V8-like Glu-specific endopeptidase